MTKRLTVIFSFVIQLVPGCKSTIINKPYKLSVLDVCYYFLFVKYFITDEMNIYAMTETCNPPITPFA